MSNQGIGRVSNYIWDDTAKDWVRETSSGGGSGTTNVSGVEVTDWTRLNYADDLVTVIQYNEPAARTTVSGITYTSSSLSLNGLEVFVSGVNTLSITRTI